MKCALLEDRQRNCCIAVHKKCRLGGNFLLPLPLNVDKLQ